MKNEEHREQTRAALRTAFLSLLQDKPWDKISVTEIANEARFSRKTFYDHYSDIYDLAADCYYELCIRDFDEMDFSDATVVEQTTDAYGRQLIKQLDTYESNRNFADMVYQNAMHSVYFAPLLAKSTALFSNFIDLYYPERERTSLVSAALLSECIFSVQQTIAHDWLIRGCPEPSDEVAIRMHFLGLRIADSIHASKEESNAWISSIVHYDFSTTPQQ